MVLHTDNDKLGGNAELYQKLRNIILSNMENFNFTDIWHYLHPQENSLHISTWDPKMFFDE